MRRTMRSCGISRLRGLLAVFSACAGACLSFAATDHSIAEFPRLPGEADDTPRFQRAVDACRGGGLLSVPSGDYEFASTLYVTNLCSVRMSPAAVVRAVKPMKWMVEIDCTWEYNTKKAPPDVYARNFNLSWSGGILDGCGIASCLALDNYAHFLLEKATFNNGRVYGVGVETRGRGYELMARDLYFHTSMPGIEGNTGLYAYGGDSHFIDIVAVNYTTGIHLSGRGSNRMSRCHVWGTSTRPIVKGVVPETLRESVCFKIDATDTVLRDCYADTGNIGFWMNGWEERMECCTYAGLKLLKDSIVIRQNRGSIWANGFYARKTSPKSVLYAFANDNSRIRWGDDCILHPFGGVPKNVVKEPTEQWAATAWPSIVPDAANAAQVLLAACDFWETTCDGAALEKGKAAWGVLSAREPREIASDPFAVAAVWRFLRSTLSHPGEERMAAERVLERSAQAADSMPDLDDFCRSAAYSAAYDATGSARWHGKMSALPSAFRRADHLADALVSRNAGGSEAKDAAISLVAYWRSRRHAIFVNQ